MVLLWAAPLAGQTVTPVAGLVITHSVRLTPGTWHVKAPAPLTQAAIVIRGDDITVDARGVTLVGASDSTLPDRYQGVAVRVAGGRGVRIVGLGVHGYRVGVMATHTQGLFLDSLDVSRTWKPRLFSTVDHESLVDWLSFHHNEHNEWLRYGSGIYLESVDSGDIANVTGEGGMNGLMAVRSERLRIWDNDFSFNSGLGIGLYRSSDNNIQHNRLDYDIRGYSDKHYHRGQDSAGLLLFEQSSRNVIAYNSVTHGGDGLFLWAGQSTMDSGTGGCNDNLIYGNDFSYAAANGIEVTFSRNTIVHNSMVGNDYGIWGGYSYDTRILGNAFAGNRTGIAIEHGQHNRVAGNDFRGDTTAVWLWADSVVPSDWGYPKHRDIRSAGAVLDSNVVLPVRVAFRIRSSDSVQIIGNAWDSDSALVLKDTAHFRIDDNRSSSRQPDDTLPPGFKRWGPPPLDDTVIPRTPSSQRDRSAIVVDEWGPHLADSVPATDSSPAFAPAITWAAKFFVWTDASDPRSKPAAFKALMARAPLLTRQESKLDYEWYAPAIESLPRERWALDAKGSVDLDHGAYSIRTISDDAIRVWVDGKLVIDDWKPHESVVDHAVIHGGRHKLEVQYYQVDGWTELRLDIVRGIETSSGSPGPH